MRIHSAAAQICAAIALLTYVFWFRTHDITQSFLLGGDQMRDWQVALRPLSSLPQTGVSSTAGGSTIGPVYYWILWCIARVIGPVVDYLPHAGGIGIAALQSAADVILFAALRRRLQSLPTALLVVLTAATSAYDATLSSTIWNPPVAVAFVKVSLAALLWKAHLTGPSAVIVVMASWLAVQCHTTGIVVAAPLIAWTILEPVIAREWRTAALRLSVAAGIVLLLQVPWLIDASRHSSGQATAITKSLEAVMAAPQHSIRLSDSAALVARSLDFLLAAPSTIPYFSVLFVAASLFTVFIARDLPLIAGSVAPVLTAIAAFSLWQGRLDQAYWFLVLVPSAAIVLVGWIDRLHSRAWIASIILLVILAAAQPARARMAWTFHRMPGYGAMVEGCRAIVKEGRTVRDVRLAFRLPPNPDPVWLFSILGGTLGSEPAPVALIDESGHVRYQ